MLALSSLHRENHEDCIPGYPKKPVGRALLEPPSETSVKLK